MGRIEVEAAGDPRLFLTSFAAITATSLAFIMRAMVIDQWGAAFALSETQKGELLGVGLWPFAITIILISLVIDRIGFRLTLALAAACHAGGLAILLTAGGYWSLWTGTFIMALGNGAVEAAVNPAVATVYAHDKPRWLNRLHAAWPAGLIVGGLLAMALGGAADWHIKIALTAVPVLLYAVLLLGTRFPVSERVAADIPYRTMLAEAGFVSALIVSALLMLEIGQLADLSPAGVVAGIAALTGAYAFHARAPGQPLYILLVVLMIPLAITELSTDSWISSLMAPQMAAIGLQAGWVLIYTACIVFVLRLSAGPLLERFNPLGVLAIASAMAAAGLFLLSSATGAALLAAATLYGAGKSFFWGTSLGLAGEQAPRGGAVALNMMAGAGMLAAGIVGSVLLGYVQDRAVSRRLADLPAAQALLVERHSLFGRYEALSPPRVAAAPAGVQAAIAAEVAASKHAALRTVAVLPLVMLAVYGALLVLFRRRGGYRAVRLAPGAHAR